MTSGRIHFRRGLFWLEGALWIAGCCALGYCAFVAVDASVTQAKLARSFQQTQTQSNVTTQSTVSPPADYSDKVRVEPETRLAARLEIPQIGLSVFVLEGMRSRTLRVGVGHVPGTPWPGQQGNVVIAGHRDTFFRPLRKIEKCDEVSLETPTHTYYYRVSAFEVVDPNDVDELTSNGKDELTLITCYPFYYIGPAPKRFVVHAEPALASEKCPPS